jgi:prophage DNA circulation protein
MRPSDLQPASFRGVRFLVPRDMTEEGRNTILHEYPDASHRYAEDNGYCPPKFNITAVVHGPRVRSATRALRNALNVPGPGTLQHPHYGAQFCAVVGPYQVIREDIDAGVVIFEIVFAVTGPALFPGLVTGIAAVVSGLAATAVTQLFSTFTAQFGAPATPASRTQLADAVANVAATTAQAFGSGAPAAARLFRDASGLVDQPSRLAALLLAAMRDPFADRTLSAPQLVAGFGRVIAAARALRVSAALIPATTADRIRRIASLGAIADTVEAAAFAGLAEAMAGRTYTTAEEVEADETALGTAWDAIQALPLASADAQILAQVFVAGSEVLRDREVRLPRITTLDASVLSYMLYDTDTHAATLTAINPRRTPLLYEGTVNVLAGPD